MAISGYIGWSTYVNKVILDSTTITVGKNATKSDELLNGWRRTKLRTLNVPDEYSVLMEFNWLDEVVDPTTNVSTGKTELQHFYDWYKYKHKFGTIPFEFPKILYSPQTGIKVYDEDAANKVVETEYYKIVDAIEASKSGYCVQMKMTWQSVYGGTINISDTTAKVSNIEATDGYVDIYFSTLADTIPVSGDFTIYIDDTETTVTGSFYNNSYTLRLYFDALNDGSSHYLQIENTSTICPVAKSDFKATFTSQSE